MFKIVCKILLRVDEFPTTFVSQEKHLQDAFNIVFKTFERWLIANLDRNRIQLAKSDQHLN